MAVVNDPDGSVDGRNVTYSWTLTKVIQPTSQDLAALAGTTNAATFTLPGGSLLAGAEYTLQVTVSKPNVSSVSAATTITVYQESVPQPVIRNIPTFVFDPAEPLSLYGDSVGSTAVGRWSWSISPTLNLNTLTDLSSATNATTRDLVLRANVLAASTTYEITLQAQASAGSAWGSSSITVTTNAPPSSGQFTVSKTSVQSLVTVVTFSASNWYDIHTPLQYKFGYYIPSAGSQQFVLRDWSALANFETSNLPLVIDFIYKCI